MPSREFEFAGRSALVTGAGAGAGRVIALALGAQGASVAASDINIERADRVADAIVADGGAADALQADISNRFQAANLIERTRDAFGAIDFLINASGIFHAEPLLDIDEWNWRRQIEVNVSGVFFVSQLVARVMADEGGGSIVNLAPAQAVNGSLPAGIGAVAGGAAVIGMTRQAARELAPHQIRVNCIAADLQAEPSAEIAEAALFLCSAEAKSISGQVLLDEGRGSLRAWLAAAARE